MRFRFFVMLSVFCLGVPMMASAASGMTANDRGFPARIVATEDLEYTGEKISLHLKDADIKDVLRTFANLTTLNIVVDPTVSGSVTVELHDVPWDQALDLILRINGLGWTLENNVLYVAPPQKLLAFL